jgi:RNA polymerase sigma-70 factor (ECF subfamily)
MRGPHDYLRDTYVRERMRDGPMNSSSALALDVLTTSQQPQAPTSDELLASRGDALSFAELYERYLPSVYRYVCARVSSREEAEDLTSEAFRQMWTSRRGYRRFGTFRAWLFSIVRRTVADYYRRRRPIAQLGPAAAERVLDDEPTPEDQVVQDERALYARDLLSQLGEEQQEILRLRFAAELTYAEIAIVVGKREAAIKKAAYRTLALLRERNIHV